VKESEKNINYEEFPCPICNKKDFRVIKERNERLILQASRSRSTFAASGHIKLFDQLVECLICKHVMTNPRLNSTDLVFEYTNSNEDTHFLQNRFRINTFYRALQKILEVIDINQKTSTINLLDIGCASGAFLCAAEKITNWKIEGIEPSRSMVAFGKREYAVNINQGVFLSENYNGRKFDVISLWDVLEHINEPDLLLKDISKVLASNGHIIINVPNLDSIVARLMGYRWPFYLAVHIHYFKNKTIKKLLDMQGLKIIYIKPYVQQLGLGYVLFRGLQSMNLNVGYSKLLRRLDKFPVSYNLGQTTYVAKKCK